jgi:4-hydroxybenzoate polyprenyltransferase
MSLRGYVQIARFDHWFKNVLVLPGCAFALVLTSHWRARPWLSVATTLLATCLVASANYVINEWLDAASDRFHPLKKDRPSALGELEGRWVAVEYVAFLAAGLGLAAWVGPQVLMVATAFAGMGLVYNVPPIRSKERPYLDVLSESINNPLRLLLGWFCIADRWIPPASLTFGYWMAGAFLMAVKRFSEMRFIGSAEVARAYRSSFGYYTPERLLTFAVFCASLASFFLGVFLVKYRIELLVCLPFLAFGFAWYVHIGMKPDSAAQSPERLYQERGFSLYMAFLALLFALMFVIDIPALEWLLSMPDY